MGDKQAKLILKKLGFSDKCIQKIEIYRENLIKYNSKYNLISKNTEKEIWSRHILDSAQLVSFLDASEATDIADFGSGAGFPGLILAFYYNKNNFHVKLYEKSSIKRQFLQRIADEFSLNVSIMGNIYEEIIDSKIIVCRAFKKLDEVIRISREKIKKPHKLLILKGKNAQNEINKVSLDKNYRYRLEESITDNDSKIIIINAK